MSDFFSTFLGNSAANSATALGARNAAQINSSYGTANDQAKQGFDQSMGYYQPYAQSGQAANTAYSNALGLNGAGAQQQQFQSGYLNDPAMAYRNANNALQMSQLQKKYNAGSSGINSGAAMMGSGQLATQQFNNDYGNYLNRLQGMQGQGLGVAQSQAGLTSNYYNSAADRSIGQGNALTSNDTNATMAANNARAGGVNNLLSVGGMAVSAMTGMPMPKRQSSTSTSSWG